MSDVGRYRRVYPRIFRHPEFKQLAPLAQRLALYVLFGPQSNRIGLFYFSVNVAAEDLNTTAESIRGALLKLASSFGWRFDAVARVVYVESWWRWNAPDHEKVLLGNLKDLNEVPPCGLVDAFARNLTYLKPELHECFLRAIATALPRAKPSQYREQESVTGNQKQKTALPRVAVNGTKPNPNNLPLPADPRMRKIAFEVIRELPSTDTDGLIDAFQDRCHRELNLKTTKQEALLALAQARESVAVPS